MEGGSTVPRSFTDLVFATVQLSVVRTMSEAKVHVGMNSTL